MFEEVRKNNEKIIDRMRIGLKVKDQHIIELDKDLVEAQEAMEKIYILGLDKVIE